MQQRCLLVKTLKPKILENVNMEEKYYNTLSLARSGVILPQNFFYGVGLGTCTIMLLWYFNN